MANPPVRLGYGEKAKVKVAEFAYDFAVDGGALGTVILGPDSIPVGWYVTRITALVEASLTSGGSATVALGAVANGDLVSAAAFGGYLINTAVTADVATSPKKTAAGGLRMTIAGATITAGKIKYIAEMVKLAA